jgi:hypothetical protein
LQAAQVVLVELQVAAALVDTGLDHYQLIPDRILLQ